MPIECVRRDIAMEKKFTLIIPTYNEAGIIRTTLARVVGDFSAHMTIPWQIIVSDNASTDNTVSEVEAFGDARVRALRLNEKGRGRAIRAGFQAAGGGIVAFTDSDLPISPLDIVEALNLILGGEYEVVIGSRFMRGADASERPKIRNIVSHGFLILAKLITGLRSSDSQCPLKMMNERTTPVMLATEDMTWWSELEYTLLVERLGITYKEMPVVWHEKEYAGRPSTVTIARDSMNAVKSMFRIRFALSKKVNAVRALLEQSA